MIWRVLIASPWIVFAAYWIFGALKTRRTVSTESFASRYAVLSMEIAGYWFLFAGTGAFGETRILPRTYALGMAGVALTWIGLGIAIWARWHLGQYWSARVTLKQDHQLIRSGPYAHFRHPIYSGLDLAALGGLLAIDELHCIAGVALIVAGYWIKAKKEESMLTSQFGEAFKDHCRQTGFLIPKF